MSTQVKQITKEAKARIYPWSKLMDEPDKIDWIVEGLYSSGSVVTITGEPGSKKTWSILDFAISEANYESDWLGFKINQHVPILIIDEESGHERLGMRLKEVCKGHNTKSRKMDIVATCISGFNFRDDVDLEELRRLVKVTKSRIVIIDTLMDVLAGGDDNASKDISPLYKGLRKIADEFRAVIILLHHTNRNGTYRGSSAIKGSSDLMIRIRSEQDSPNIDFEIEKKRDEVPVTKWAAYIYSHDGAFTLRKSGKQPSKVGKVQEHVIKYLYDYNRATIEDMQSNNGGHSVSSIKGAAYKLIKDKYVSSDGFDGKKKCYILTQEGKHYAETFFPVELDLSLLVNQPNGKKSSKK